MEKLNPKIAKRKAVEAEPKGSDYYYNPSTREMELKSDPSPHRQTLQAAKKAAYNNPNAKYVSKEQRIYEALKVPGYETPEKSNASYKKLKENENNIAYNSTTGKIFDAWKNDPNVRIPQKDLVSQIQKEQDQKEIYPSGMGDEKNYKSDLRTPNQRKKEAWAEKIAKKPKPNPVPLEWDW